MARSDNLTGAFLMMGAMAAFTVNDAMIKGLAGQIPVFQVMFLRGVLTTLLVGVIAWRMGALARRLPRADWGPVFWRMVGEIGSAYFFVTALFNMPIANISAIMQALPLTITLAAALFFREPVGWRRMSAIMAGFVGVMLIVRPGTDGFNVYSVYGLAAVAFVTLRDLATRRLSRDVPSMLVTLITSFCIMAAFGLASLTGEWATLDMRSVALIAGASVMIIGGYLCSIMVMRVGEISFVAPFRYTSLLWALILGWLIFGDWPQTITLIGAAIVVASGLFTLYREAQVSRRARAEEKRQLSLGPRPR
ncbi:S-adenosylmethionine uptake transporter [Roseovarius azorensis]|uniref:S-adenosylmethionine uptake transporter n=1 Tax=Roseovarius azorensis TaxID=1287727 RepID=A0A1H7UUF0_9RHOB|nr:DMT family transporter [Roseovarius azorensis]SEM00077.1 S-adenosylmethionine uptake transporter [Roseovarius azorensis]